VRPNFIVHGKKFHFSRKSLYMFTSSNKFRQMCVWLIKHKWFDRFIMLFIIINAINIASTDYSYRLEDSEQSTNDIKAKIERTITIIFIIEFMLKVISMGFFRDKNSYLRDTWNRIDFVVVFFGCFSLIFPQYNSGLNFIGYVRNVRLLRPLRTINRIKGLRILVNSLIDSIPYIANVAVFLIFIILIFSIFGLHLFSGILENRCRLTEEPINGTWEIL